MLWRPSERHQVGVASLEGDTGAYRTVAANGRRFQCARPAVTDLGLRCSPRGRFRGSAAVGSVVARALVATLTLATGAVAHNATPSADRLSAAAFMWPTDALTTATPEKSLMAYTVTATVDPSNGSLRVAADVLIPSANVKTTMEFALGSTYRIESVHAGPDADVEVVPTKLDEGQQRIIIHCGTPHRSDVRLDVQYGGPLLILSKPPINSVTPDLIELTFDSYWLPSPLPSANFTVRADITGVPPDMIVVANGSVRRSRGDVRITRLTGDLDLALVGARGLQRKTEGAFELYACDVSSQTAQIYMRQGAGAVAFLEHWFGLLPRRPVRVVVVRRERRSGYSRPGYIVVTEHPAGDPLQESAAAKFIAHELAHEWWSCPPCDPRTEDRWLSESMAEYVALRYI